MVRQFIAFVAACMLGSLASASESIPSVRTITPIFSQLLQLSFPKGFTPTFEDARGDHYIREAVPKGERAGQWSQMITITGAKGLASNPKITPIAFANAIAGGFKQSCPNTFNANPIGGTKLDNHDAFMAVVSCGTASPIGDAYSESLLLIVVKGENDYYTIQWAERGTPTNNPIAFDIAKWTERLKVLTPLRLCPIVPGERAPYPSCINRIEPSQRASL